MSFTFRFAPIPSQTGNFFQPELSMLSLKDTIDFSYRCQMRLEISFNHREFAIPFLKVKLTCYVSLPIKAK